MGRRVGLSAIFAAVVFCLALNGASGDDGALPSSEATEIGKIICTPEEFHDATWFKCIECCQSINAYLLNKPGKECNREARRIFVRDPNLSAKSRVKVCVGIKAYNMILKKVVLDLKGNIRPECVTAEGMESLFGEKVGCFRACADKNYADGIIKKWCPTFKG